VRKQVNSCLSEQMFVCKRVSEGVVQRWEDEWRFKHVGWEGYAKNVQLSVRAQEERSR
jgi:hypothetical protein